MRHRRKPRKPIENQSLVATSDRAFFANCESKNSSKNLLSRWRTCHRGFFIAEQIKPTDLKIMDKKIIIAAAIGGLLAIIAAETKPVKYIAGKVSELAG